MSIKQNIDKLKDELKEYDFTLIAVSKYHPVDSVLEAYKSGQRDFGENKVQELVQKQPDLPKDIKWHMIGHLQRNKVKYIAPFVHLIHSVDSLKLLKEINKEARKNERVINCLLQIHIAQEETKHGLSRNECEKLLGSEELKGLQNIKITGLMTMASNTEDCNQVRKEFIEVKSFFNEFREQYKFANVDLNELSMGMSGDYKIALEEGSTIIRIGTAIFGKRNY